jgi:hypothetical protein
MLTDEQKPIFRQLLKLVLDNGGRAEIHFKKLDDTDRVLIATSKIPEDKLPASTTDALTQTHPDGIVRIFSEVEQDWRSVKVERIEKLVILL